MIGPFGYAALFALTAASAFFLRWLAARRRLTVEAREEYEERVATKAGTVKGVDERAFVRLYVAASEPRWALYAAGALLLAVLITPPAGIGLMLVWPLITQNLLDGGPWYDVGYYPWMFYMFFGMVAVWAVCAASVARIHHARAPEPFNAALARARGEPLDNIEIKRPRPNWAKKARPSWAPDLSHLEKKDETDDDKDKTD